MDKLTYRLDVDTNWGSVQRFIKEPSLKEAIEKTFDGNDGSSIKKATLFPYENNS